MARCAIVHRFMGWLVGQELGKNMIGKFVMGKFDEKGMWIYLSE